MAGYTAIAMLTLALARRRMWRALGLFAGLGWLLCAVIFVVTRHADPSLAYNRAALSRSYFFLSSWRWYEYPGLLIPLLLLGIAGAHGRAPWPARALAIAATIVGGCALLTSLCFVHRSGSLLLARFQVLRAFQFVYIAGVLLAGGMLARLAQQQSVPSACYVCCCWAPCLPVRGSPIRSPTMWNGLDKRHAIAGSRLSSGFAPTRPGMRSSRSITTTSKAPERMRRAFAQPRKEAPSPTGLKTVASPATFLRRPFPGGKGRRPPRSSTAPPMSSAWPDFGPSASPGLSCLPQASTSFPCPFTNARVRVCRLAVSRTDGAK